MWQFWQFESQVKVVLAAVTITGINTIVNVETFSRPFGETALSTGEQWWKMAAGGADELQSGDAEGVCPCRSHHLCSYLCQRLRVCSTPPSEQLHSKSGSWCGRGKAFFRYRMQSILFIHYGKLQCHLAHRKNTQKNIKVTKNKQQTNNKQPKTNHHSV